MGLKSEIGVYRDKRGSWGGIPPVGRVTRTAASKVKTSRAARRKRRGVRLMSGCGLLDVDGETSARPSIVAGLLQFIIFR